MSKKFFKGVAALLLGLSVLAVSTARSQETPAAEASAAEAPAAAAPSAKPLAGYDKGFYLGDESGAFLLKIAGRVQARYTLESLDEGEGIDRTLESNFSIPRARIKLKGHIISKKVAYAFQADFGKGGAALKDFYVDFAFVPGKFHLKVGQFKKPFSRQQVTSSGNQELVDRAITDKAFGAGRDIGVMLHNNFTKSPGFEWALGLFNGTGDKGHFHGSVDADGVVTGKTSNVPDKFHPLLVARVGVNTGGLKGYSEADLEGGGARFGAGLSGILDFDADNSNDGNIRAEADYIFKVSGFSTTGGIYLATVQDGLHFSDQAYRQLGVHLQAGYVIAGKVQPVVRYAVVNPDGADNNKQEVLGGLSVYIGKHHLKWQTDGGAIIDDNGGDKRTDGVIRTQLQLAF